MNTKKIDLDITMRRSQGFLNARLTGFAFLQAGFLHGTITDLGKLSASERVLTTAFTFTGCPIAARSEREDWNPWIDTNGTYSSRRHLQSSDFEVESELTSIGNNDTINMSLYLKVEGIIPKITHTIHPFQEVIQQIKIGHLAGRFELDFFNSEGNPIHAVAHTDYRLPITRAVNKVWRNITIINNINKNSLEQVEQIDLFASESDADTDLRSKINVVARSGS